MPLFSLLNTRPAHQANELNALVIELGGKVIDCPIMQIVWLKPSLQGLPNEFDKLIFTSSNAVEGWVSWIKWLENNPERGFLQHSSKPACFAIGKATKQKGRACGLEINTLSTSHFDSEHFLAHTEMQQVNGSIIGLVKGVGGRELIADTLTQRGAKVVPIEVYQREMVDFCWQAWQSFVKSSKPILLITSLESWHNILQGLQSYIADQHSLLEQLNSLEGLVVMSQRIADEIRQAGYLGALQVVATQTNDGIVQSIKNYL